MTLGSAGSSPGHHDPATIGAKPRADLVLRLRDFAADLRAAGFHDRAADVEAAARLIDG